MSLEESAVFATQLTRIMVFMYLDRRERAPSMKQGEMVIKRIRKNFKTILGYNPTTLKHMRQYLKWKIKKKAEEKADRNDDDTKRRSRLLTKTPNEMMTTRKWKLQTATRRYQRRLKILQLGQKLRSRVCSVMLAISQSTNSFHVWRCREQKERKSQRTRLDPLRYVSENFDVFTRNIGNRELELYRK